MMLVGWLGSAPSRQITRPRSGLLYQCALSAMSYRLGQGYLPSCLRCSFAGCATTMMWTRCAFAKRLSVRMAQPVYSVCIISRGRIVLKLVPGIDHDDVRVEPVHRGGHRFEQPGQARLGVIVRDEEAEMLVDEGVGGCAFLRRQVPFQLLAVERAQRAAVIGHRPLLE